jgi:hypothetical protein
MRNAGHADEGRYLVRHQRFDAQSASSSKTNGDSIVLLASGLDRSCDGKSRQTRVLSRLSMSRCVGLVLGCQRAKPSSAIRSIVSNDSKIARDSRLP